jgi:hypothetical protein
MRLRPSGATADRSAKDEMITHDVVTLRNPAILDRPRE